MGTREKPPSTIGCAHDAGGHTREGAGCAERLASLSEREAEIAQWVKLGKSNGEIASLSNVSENTVKHHLTSIFGKLGVETRGQLACWLMEHQTVAKPGFVTRVV